MIGKATWCVFLLRDDSYAGLLRWVEIDKLPDTARGRSLTSLASLPRASRCRGFAIQSGFFNRTWWIQLHDTDEITTWIEMHRESYLDGLYAQATSFIIPHLEAAVGDCAGGVLTAFVNGLPFVSQRHGDEAAFRCFTIAGIILKAVRAQGIDHMNDAKQKPDVIGSKITKKWDWRLLRSQIGTEQAPNFPMLHYIFGTRQRTCGQFAPRVHVIANEERTNYAVRCSSGLRATEVWFHRQLIHSDCSVLDFTLDQADFIFLPLYSVCRHIQRNRWNPMHLHTPLVRPYYELSEETESLLDEVHERFGPDVWNRVLLFFPEEKWPLFGAGQSVRPRARRLVVEAKPVHCTHYDRVRTEALTTTDNRMRCFHCHDCFRPGFDIVVPSFIDYYSRSRLLQENVPYHERDLLLVFHGAGGKGSADGTYTEVLNWRDEIHNLAAFPYVSIGQHVSYYWELLGMGQFCLVPKGVGYWTHRLFEAITAGCIPVILADHVVLPFQGVLGIDWRDFSIRWPEDLLGPELYSWLVTMSKSPRGAAMKAKLDEVACWFDYHGREARSSSLGGEVEKCSVLVATMEALKNAARTEGSVSAAQRIEASTKGFWNTPGPFPLRAQREPQEQLRRWLKKVYSNMTDGDVTEALQEASEFFGGTMS